SCPAWRNQSLPSNARTCKHIRKMRGDAAEELRLATAGPLKPLKPEGSEDVKELDILLANKWNDEDPTGWWMSEKLDGVRAYWDGKQFLSRRNNIYFAPDWFIAGLPNHPLDGEIWFARKQFDRASEIVRSQGTPDRWKDLKFLVFDAPDAPGVFEDRTKFLQDNVGGWKNPFTTILEHAPCTGMDHLLEELDRVTGLGGEGLMLRKPKSKYERTRSSTLLKVKKFDDREVTVAGYEDGKGRHKGRVGALWIKLANGKECKVGTGLKDRDRDNPPPIGSIITVKYQEETPDGLLRFPVYVGVRVETALPVAAPMKETAPVAAPPEAPAAPVASAAVPKPVSRSTSSPAPKGGPTMSATTNTTETALDTTVKRYFECTEDGASKFWEVWTD
ncbi:MAG: DNA ligase, partial [Gemmataceae bacterium]|nr:DNA ligase [Gemmataceae bacterium]